MQLVRLGSADEFLDRYADVSAGHAGCAGGLSLAMADLLSRLLDGYPDADRRLAVARAIRAIEHVRAAEGALASALAELEAIAATEAADSEGSSLQGDVHAGVLRSLAAEVAVPTAQNGRSLHARIAEAGEFARSLPALTRVHRAGALSAAHLRAAERAAANLAGSTASGEGLRDVFESRLLVEAVRFSVPGDVSSSPVGTMLTPRQFGKLAARIVAELAPGKTVDEFEEAMRDRRVYVEPITPGMSSLTMVGPTILVEAAFDRLRQAARALDHPDEPRTLAQREADTAFMLLIAGQLTAGSTGCAERTAAAGTAAAGPDTDGAGAGAGVGTAAPDAHAPVDVAAILARIRPTVHLTVPALALAGRDDAGPAMLDDESPIPADLAATLCGQAHLWTRILTDPLNGTPIAADTYAPGRELRRAIQARDRTCRAPGCTIPAHRCDLDPTPPWAEGGRTTGDNLSALCRYHHRMREYGWALAQPAPGILEWTSPGGRTYRTTPNRIAMITGPPDTDPPDSAPPDDSPSTPPDDEPGGATRTSPPTPSRLAPPPSPAALVDAPAPF